MKAAPALRPGEGSADFGDGLVTILVQLPDLLLLGPEFIRGRRWLRFDRGG
jgi:hypothetical protein